MGLMMGCMLLLLYVLAGLRALECATVSSLKNQPVPGPPQNSLVPGPPQNSLVPGRPQNISKNDQGLRKAVLFGTYAFNNQSNDAFLFRPSLIEDAQRQIIKGIRYIADVEISRTVCRKMEHEDLVNCDFQPDGLLQQTFVCHFEVWAIPWQHQMKTTYFICHVEEKTSD